MADALAARSDAVASRLESCDACGARAEAEALQADTIAAVNAGRIPARYQEELGSSVAVLVDSIECLPRPVADEDDEVPAGSTPAEQTRNLSDWLRDNSG